MVDFLYWFFVVSGGYVLGSMRAHELVIDTFSELAYHFKAWRRNKQDKKAKKSNKVKEQDLKKMRLATTLPTTPSPAMDRELQEAWAEVEKEFPTKYISR